jgi:uncharacterized alpha-E superfamily protein
MNVLVDLNERREAAAAVRATVDNERWQSLLALLIDAEVLAPAEVAGMCERLADRLETHDGREFTDGAMRARNVARLCREVRCG